VSTEPHEVSFPFLPAASEEEQKYTRTIYSQKRRGVNAPIKPAHIVHHHKLNGGAIIR
jgi:nitrate/TMAO reductase-like tetraheme cytochrome c subunit